MRCSLCLIALLAGNVLAAQAIEDVLVETYATWPDPSGGATPMTTYRIYIDLADGYQLQMVYGDGRHPLKISTSTWFFNDTVNGGKFADDIHGNALREGPLAFDSWLTIGAASDMHRAVPIDLDPDGSIIHCPPPTTGLTSVPSTGQHPRRALCSQDGLVRDTALRDIVDFKFASGYLHRSKGNLLETVDGAWAALGGAKGATPENRVLIAQLSTTGQLSFKLNVQVAGPDRKPVKYVWGDAANGEVLFEGLSLDLAH